MNIDAKLLDSISQYCALNDIGDIEKEVNRLLQIGFNVERYGNSPFDKLKQSETGKSIKAEEKPLKEPKNNEIEHNIDVPIKTKIRIIKTK